MRFVPYILSALAMILSGLMLYNGHNWGGDFSQYIAQAIALADNNIALQIANNTYIVENSPLRNGLAPHIAPWGVSILLALIYKIFGFNLIAFKMLIVAIYGIFVFVFYRFCERFLEWRFCTIATMLFTLNPMFLSFCNNIISDIPFLLFSFLSVVFLAGLFDSANRRVSMRYALLGGICALFAYLTRTNGAVIIVALFIMQIMLILNKRFALITPRAISAPTQSTNLAYIVAHIVPYVIFIIGVFCANYALGSGGSGHIAILSQISPKSIAINLAFYSYVLSDFFALPNPFYALYSDFRYAYILPNPLNFALFILSVPLIWRGFKICLTKKPESTAFIALFMIGFMALLILWPARQGIRYAFGVIPFLVFFGAVGLAKCGNLARFATIALLICFGIKDISIIAKNITNDFSPANIAAEAYSDEAKDMYEFIKAHTPKEAKIIFFKPRVLYLNANRLGFHATKLEDFKKADFALELRWEWLETEMIQGFIDELKTQNALQKVYENKHFTLYKIDF